MAALLLALQSQCPLVDNANMLESTFNKLAAPSMLLQDSLLLVELR